LRKKVLITLGFFGGEFLSRVGRKKEGRVWLTSVVEANTFALFLLFAGGRSFNTGGKRRKGRKPFPPCTADKVRKTPDYSSDITERKKKGRRLLPPAKSSQKEEASLRQRGRRKKGDLSDRKSQHSRRVDL